MNDKTQILERLVFQAKELTIINDGQFKYPVKTTAFKAWIKEHGPITNDNYEQFCFDVDCVGEKELGTPGSRDMINFCQALLENGADLERLA